MSYRSLLMWRPILLLRRLSRLLVVRVVSFALVVLLAGVLTPFVPTGVPESLVERFGPDAVLPILNLLAPTMLTVTTFALGIMVQSSRAAQSMATPRAFRLLMEDTTTQNVLAVFTGSFLFALMGIVMFQSGVYGQTEGVIVFGMTVLVIVAIVVSIVRWIGHLNHLGSLDHTLDVVTHATRASLQTYATSPSLGAQTLRDIPDGHALRATKTGYLQFIDLSDAQDMLEACDAQMHVEVPLGSFVTKGQRLATLTGDAPDDDVTNSLAACFGQGGERTMEQDARFGLVILAEIAARALSPGVNDPGTAVDVIHRATGLLAELVPETEAKPEFDRVYLPPVTASDLVEDAFYMIVRFGAGHRDVAWQLCAACDRLEQTDWADMAKAAGQARGYLAEHVARADLSDSDAGALTDRLKA